jgi:ketosteroid isomerase-like protein
MSCSRGRPIPAHARDDQRPARAAATIPPDAARSGTALGTSGIEKKDEELRVPMTSAPEHPNVGRLREAFVAFGRGDLEAFRTFFGDDLVWHVSSPKRFAGARRGWSELLQYLALLSRETDGTMRMEPPFQVLADDAYGFALLRISRQRRGRTLTNQATQVVRFEDSRIVEAWFFDEDPYELDDFYA